MAPERLLGGSVGQGCLLTALDGLLGVERRWRHEQKGGNEALARLATLPRYLGAVGGLMGSGAGKGNGCLP